MDPNAVKVWLKNYRDLSCRRDALLDELHHLMDASTRVTAVLSDTPHSSSKNNGGFSGKAVAYVDGQKHLQEIVQHVDEALTARLAMIDMLTCEQYRLVLTLRYINGLDWWKVENAMHYERRQVFYFHKKALVALAAVLDEQRSIYLDYQFAI